MMSIRLAAALLASVAFAAPSVVLAQDAAEISASAPAEIVPPKIEYNERTLSNGLKVISIPDESTATVSVSMWYDVGSKHDPEGRSGFAHLFEHILSRKTVNMAAGTMNQLTEDVGGSRNASTWFDRTNYYEVVPAEYLETMLWTHAERMARPVIDPEVFDNERNVVKEELRQRVLAPPYGRLFSFVLYENSFDNVPERRPVIGSIEDLDSATLEDARAFHEAYYGPDTATLIVAGNFDQAQLDAWVDRYFAGIPRRPNPVPLEITAKDPKRTVARTVVAHAPNVPLPVAGASYQAVPVGHPDAAALTVLDAIMSSGESSRFYNALVRSGKASQVSEAMLLMEGAGLIAPFAFAGEGQDVEEVAAALDGVIDNVRENGVTEAEVAEAKTEVLAGALGSRETASGRAFELGEAIVETGDPDAADKRLAAIAAVSVADVNRVAKQYYDPAGRVVLRYLAGDGDPSEWANPAPMPEFRSVPPATEAPLELAAEGEREQPPAPGNPPEVAQPEMVRTTLANGMDVVAAETSQVPIVSMTVIIPGGAETDPRDKAGRADLAASLLTSGTTSRSGEEIAADLERLGASLSASAISDGIIVGLSAPLATVEEAGKLLTEVIAFPSFPEDEFETQKARSLDGLKVALNDPGGLADLVATPVLYGDTPYGTLSSGTVESLEKLTREDLVEYHRKWWHPENATVIVTGGAAPERAVALANHMLGGWMPEGAAPPVPEAPVLTDYTPRTVVVDLPGAGQASVTAAMPALTRADPRYYDLYIANTVLGSGSNSRLFDEVRTKRALSYGAYSGFPARRGTAMLAASAQTKNESAAEVAKIFLEQFDRLGTEAFDAETLATRKLYRLGGIQRSMETASGYGGQVANLVLRGLSPVDALDVTNRIEAVTPESALKAAAELVSGDRATLIIVGDASQFLEPLKALRPDVEVYEAKDLDLSRADLGRAAD